MNITNNKYQFQKKWMSKVLIAAGIYNILFGIFAVIFPSLYFSISGMEQPMYPQLWQCIGMIVGVYGIGYLIASNAPSKHWPIVLVGLLGKIFGPIGFTMNYLSGAFPLSAGWMIILNDLIWIVPFAYIVKSAYDKTVYQDDMIIEMMNHDSKITLDLFDTSEGISLLEMTNRWPTLIVFLRHFGCTFCREALNDIKEVRNNIEIKGTRIVVVHMMDEDSADKQLANFGLADIPHISDPESLLYKKFRLHKGSLSQLFGFKVMVRGIIAGLVKGNGIGKEMGDIYQMPGVFLLRRGEIVNKYVHQTAADRPDYEDLAACHV